MPIKWISGKVFPIGIDLGTATLKMAQLKQHDGALELHAAGCAILPPDARKNPAVRNRFNVEAIRQLAKRYPFKGKRCVMSIPAEATFVQHIKVAKMPEEQLKTALQWELQGKLPYDPSQAVIRHVVAGEIFAEGEIRLEVIVLAVSRDAVDAHLEIARQAKLECEAINVEPCAIVDSFARLFRRADDNQRATLFVDLGATTTQVVISHGPNLVFAKNLSIGGGQFDQAVADGMQLPLEEAQQLRRDIQASEEAAPNLREVYHLLDGQIQSLGAELTNCLRYYDTVFHNQPVERMIFLGGQAHDKRLCQIIAQRLALPARIGDPLARVGRNEGAGMDIGLDRRNVQPAWAVAVGLSLGAETASLQTAAAMA